jgi:inner membrane protein involved in colicin E2 resistance
MYLTRHIDWFRLALASTEHGSAEFDRGGSV